MDNIQQHPDAVQKGLELIVPASAASSKVGPGKDACALSYIGFVSSNVFLDLPAGYFNAV